MSAYALVEPNTGQEVNDYDSRTELEDIKDKV